MPPVLAERFLRIIDRASAIEKAAQTARVIDPNYTATLKEVEAELESQSTDWNGRRAVKLELADYMDRVGQQELRPDVLDAAKALRECRDHGFIGIGPQGVVKAWDQKCEMVRLCPDEARDETARLAEKYVPELVRWASEKPGRRLQYAVLTAPNFPAGELERAKSLLFDQLQDRILKAKYQAAPIEWIYTPRGKVCKRTRKRTIAKFPSIKGALVVQEDPLSAHGDWNVHLNVIFAVDGPIDWKELRQEWGWGLHIRELPHEVKALTGAVKELAKYSAQAVATKSATKSARHSTKAPPMTEWPGALWCEWFDAQQRFRRTRSYGCFYGITFEPETFPMDEIEWIGEVEWDPAAARYRVALIRGDKFFSSGGSRYAPGADYAPEMISRPPPRPPDWGEAFQ